MEIANDDALEEALALFRKMVSHWKRNLLRESAACRIEQALLDAMADELAGFASFVRGLNGAGTTGGVQ